MEENDVFNSDCGLTFFLSKRSCYFYNKDHEK